jgi:hypothetical protein
VNAPSKFTPTRAVEVQDETGRFWLSDLGRRFMRGVYESRKQDGYAVFFQDSNTRAAYEVRTLAGARTYLVTSDMLAVAEHAARSMPAQAVTVADLPCPTGFVVFEEAVVMPDVHGKRLAFVAFAWSIVMDSKGEGGVTWTYYGDALDDRDEYVADLPDRWHHTRLLYIGEDRELFGAGEVPAEEVAEAIGEHVDVETIREARLYMRRLPLALWSLMQSEGVAEATTERADRAARRRLEKANSPMTGDVVVVRLRRAHADTGDGEGDSAVAWSRRWIVSGHWRRAWRPSVQAHRLVWVAPFVKGPEDKPLVIPRRVHVLER